MTTTISSVDRMPMACVVMSSRPAVRQWCCVVRRETWARLISRPVGQDITLSRMHASELGVASRDCDAGFIVELEAMGLDEVRAMVRASCTRPIVVITQDASSVVALVRSGVRVCIEVASVEDDIGLAMTAATRGLAVWSTSLSERLQFVVDQGADEGPDAPRPSVRERELVALFSRGLSYDDAANALGISANTVRTHVRSLYTKLQVANKTEAVMAARKKGWFE